MAQNYSGMTAGTYYIRGGIKESSLTEKPVYEANKATLLSAFGVNICDYFENFRCYSNKLAAEVNESGEIRAYYGGIASCYVDRGGNFGCTNHH